MCGINGIINKQMHSGIEEQLHSMNHAIVHRGPDDEGTYIHENRVAIGMRRLSVVDLSTGRQPIFNEDKSLAIVFNGEIYNYQSLRSEMQAKGIVFNTQSDTEVILRMYEVYGVNFLQRLNGVFAFAILDKNKNNIFIARDRLGEKPLYYYHDQEKFVFASELKSIVKSQNFDTTISQKALNLYFNLTFIPAPFTIYEHVYKLEPAHFLQINCSTLEFKKECYWKNKPGENISEITYVDAKKKVTDLLFDAVGIRLHADVSVGTFLSGGVDSSIVTAIASKISTTSIQTFSIGFADKRYDESEQASLVAKHCNTNHHKYNLNPDDLLHDIDKVILNYDEPYADSSALPTYFVSKMAAKEVKVVLTGDGGDETFGGYNRYLMKQYGRKYTSFVPEILHNNLLKPFINNFPFRNETTRSKSYKLRKLINSIGYSDAELIQKIMSLGFQADELSNILQKSDSDFVLSWIKKIYDEVYDKSYLQKARYTDRYLSLEGDMLVKVDRAAFLASLETRAPLLDYRLVEFTDSLPDIFLINGDNKKRILKETFANLLPKGLFDMPKKGFEIPIGSWLKNELKEDFLKVTNTNLLRSQGVLNAQEVETLFNEHLKGYKDHSFKLWTIYCFQKWILNIHTKNF